MKHEKKVTVTHTVYTCDFCSEETAVHRVCYGCGKDMCGKCVNYFDYDRFTWDYLGDNEWPICDLCSEIIKPYENDAKEILDYAGIQLEGIREMWQLRCRS